MADDIPAAAPADLTPDQATATLAQMRRRPPTGAACSNHPGRSPSAAQCTHQQ